MPHRLAFAPAFLLIVATSFGLILDAATPAPGVPVAAIFPPGVDQAGALQAVAAAPEDWRLVNLGLAWPVTVLTLVGGTTSAAAFRHATGAWLTIGLPLAGGCLTVPTSQGTRS